jgi:glucans biosynthesis protein C
LIRHNIAIDYLRAFVVLLVLAHHSVIAYAPYAHFDQLHYLWGAPIVDTARWPGFDLLTLFNDIFFMSLMFFLSYPACSSGRALSARDA